MRDRFTGFATALLVLAVFFFGNLGYILERTTPDPLFYTNIPVPVHKGEYFLGDNLIMTIDRCNNENKVISFVANREFYNLDSGSRVPLPAGVGEQQGGCQTVKLELIDPFPDSMPAGRYMVRGVLEVSGTYKRSQIFWHSQPFYYQRTGGGS